MLKTLNHIMRMTFWSVFIWLVLRIFVFQPFNVPTDSMNNTLKSGDYIFVNKIAYGARLPITPLALPYSNVYLDWIQIPYFRILGYSEIKQNDIVVFNFPSEDKLPIDHRQHYVKRCLGVAGDQFQIKNGNIIINGKALIESENILWATDNNKKRIILDSNFYNPTIFPNSSSIRWNTDHFGPLYIPKKNDSILLTKSNLQIYKRIIENFEHNQLKLINDTFYINTKPITHYHFKMNYYFMMGDNRNNSIDSRFWGFVPEDHIIGRIF